MDDNKPIVVVTGFGPFGIHEKNASWEAVKLLPFMNIEKECNVKLVIQEVVVAYKEVFETVPKLWRYYRPMLMVHVGVSHLAECLTLESCAFKSGYCRPDVKACILENESIGLGVGENLKTKLNLNKIKCEAEQHSVTLCISDNAGRYLCEFIYYISLSTDCHRTVFIHVPMIKKDYTIHKIAENLKIVIKLVLKQLQGNL